jgi:hypothetical protein
MIVEGIVIVISVVSVVVIVTYWGGDPANRVFDILIDDEKVATQKLKSPKQGEFMDMTYPVSVDLIRGK